MSADLMCRALIDLILWMDDSEDLEILMAFCGWLFEKQDAKRREELGYE